MWQAENMCSKLSFKCLLMGLTCSGFSWVIATRVPGGRVHSPRNVGPTVSASVGGFFDSLDTLFWGTIPKQWMQIGGVIITISHRQSHNKLPERFTPLNRALLWWRFLSDKLSWDINTRSTQPCIFSGVAQSSTSFGWSKGGKVTAVEWQVTLCGPMACDFPYRGELIHIQHIQSVTYLLTLFTRVVTKSMWLQLVRER